MDKTVWVAKSCYTEMIHLARNFFPRETGGMLLGYTADNGQAVVTSIIGPGPRAKHTPIRFSPDGDYQQTALEARFHKTNGVETYLGDWHTHPRGAARLSRLDKRTLAKIAATPSSDTAHPIMTVLAGGPSHWKLVGARFLTSREHWFFTAYEVMPLDPHFFQQLPGSPHE